MMTFNRLITGYRRNGLAKARIGLGSYGYKRNILLNVLYLLIVLYNAGYLTDAQSIISSSITNPQHMIQSRPLKITSLTSEEQSQIEQSQNIGNHSHSLNNISDVGNFPLNQSQTPALINHASTSASPSNGYKMILKSYDTKQDVLYVDMIPMENSNEHEPRIELRSQFQMGAKYPFVTVDERAPNETFVAAILASDRDPGLGGELEVSIESGNELNDFKLIRLVTASNLYSILVSGAPLSPTRCQEYNLNIVAKDRGQPPKSSSLGLVIKINSTQSTWGSSQIDPWHSSQNPNEPDTELIYIALKLVTLFIVLILLTMFIFALGYKR